MPEQSKRPLSSSAAYDPTLDRRRELTAARVRRYRERKHAEQASHSTTRPTQAQLSQGEQIIDFGPTAELETAQTLLSLGLRINGLTLAQDSTNNLLQQDTTPVDEHVSLYQTPRQVSTNPGTQDARRRPPVPISSKQSTLTGFVTVQPRGNPFAPPIPTATPRSSYLSPPARPSFSPLTISSIFERSSNHSPSVRPFSPLSALRSDSSHQKSRDPIYIDNNCVDSDDEADGEDAHNQDDRQTARIDIATGSPSLLPSSSIIDHTQPFQSEDIEQAYSSQEQNRSEGPVNSIPYTEQGLERSRSNSRSAGSRHSSEEERLLAATAVQLTADKIIELFQARDLGCTDDEHQQQYQEHTANTADHYSLNDIFNDADTISVLASPDLLTPEKLARYTFPTVRQQEATFCGILPHQTYPQNVCLHQEEIQAQSYRQAFDIDSYLGFLSSLGACRHGLWHQPVPQARQNLSTDLHIQTTSFPTNDNSEEAIPQAVPTMLRDVPHFLLGRASGAHDITIYILFPHLDHNGDRFIALTKEQLTRWLDLVFYPAVHRHCEAHITQHLPASFRHAFANSKARQVEGRQVHTNSYQAQQSFGYHLQPEYLADIWTDILRTVETLPGVRDFREPQLFFSAKGSKLQFKTSPVRPSLLDAMQHFETYLEDIFRPDLVDWPRIYIDLASEICPDPSYIGTQPVPEAEEPQVLSWKRCCQEKIMKWLYNGRPPARSGPGQRYYTQNMLRDACNASSAPPKRSELYKGGVRYIQLYGSVKEVWDAAQSHPFDNDGLEEIALDPLIQQAARSLASGRYRDKTIIERAYRASKSRAHQALRDSRKKSFGVRMEVRMTWELFQELMRRLRLRPYEQSQVSYDSCPTFIWPIKTHVYLNFLWRSADKFASLFETVRARARKDITTWEQTKLMAMSLRCLRFVFGAHQLARESALWWSRRERPVGNPPRLKVWYGLGFCNTLPRYGYCWLEPRINWAELEFQETVTDHLLFGNNMLRGQYLRRGGQVEDFFNVSQRLDLALKWAKQFHALTVVRDRLVFWIVHLCLQQLRVDFVSSIKADIQSTHYEEARRGNVPLCYEYLQEIMTHTPYLISGNRCDFKRPSHLARYLFDFNDGHTRKHWDNRPFRKLYQRAHHGLSLLPPESNSTATFERRFWRCFFAYHWVLPYSSPEVFTQTTKLGERMIYSIQLKEDVTEHISLVEARRWQWARKTWQAGHPPDIPSYVSWTKGQWNEWIDRNSSMDTAPNRAEGVTR